MFDFDQSDGRRGFKMMRLWSGIWGLYFVIHGDSSLL